MTLCTTNPLLASHHLRLFCDYWPLIVFCRQYALLLSYFQYCGSIVDSDVPPSVLRILLLEEQEADDDDFTLQKVLSCCITFFPLCNVTLALSLSCLSKGSQGAQWISTGQLFHHKEGSSSYRRFGKPFFCLCETRAVYFCLCKGNITYCKFFSTCASWHGYMYP